MLCYVEEDNNFDRETKKMFDRVSSRSLALSAAFYGRLVYICCQWRTPNHSIDQKFRYMSSLVILVKVHTNMLSQTNFGEGSHKEKSMEIGFSVL